MKTREDAASEYLLNTISKSYLYYLWDQKLLPLLKQFASPRLLIIFGVCIYPLVLRVMVFSLKASYQFPAEHLVLVAVFFSSFIYKIFFVKMRGAYFGRATYVKVYIFVTL